ncbi:efflux RND transporter periplasmic adaptor subunit [Paraburkholderia humisilvae]|uniref:Multidrug resistance protein MdtA n=1 Tax=Paraburkholderia humisilvae TaxID=627669 RepID=A0A6J5EGZ2_9BURK|nr:efflux RND transporter periplasmic adaptor subunit [Paraburkholderia humisilvae]CAB3765870.1 Multidrug resistance protein MdtA [Paraburkholderia humisilvae]
MNTTPVPQFRSLTKGMLVMLICLGLLFAALIGLNVFKNKMIAKFVDSMATEPAAVSATRVGYETWQPRIDAVGSLRAARGVDVTSEVTGLVRAVRFSSGEDLKAGAVLIELNDDTDAAQLQSYKAAAELAQTVYRRDAAQYQINAIARAVLDADAADLKIKKAQVVQQQALVDKKTIRAPFAGRVGIATINPGQYLKPGDPIVTLQAIEPLFADFSVPQDQVSKLAAGQTVTIRTSARPGESFMGRITSTSPKIDTATRTVQVEARIDNRDGKLLPGMYASIHIDAGAPHRYLTLPQTALTYNAYGTTLFVVQPGRQTNEQGKVLPVAQQVFVTPGPTRGDQVAIVKGISEGAQIVTSGQLKLSNGTPLIIENSALPGNDATPAPQEQ